MFSSSFFHAPAHVLRLSIFQEVKGWTRQSTAYNFVVRSLVRRKISMVLKAIHLKLIGAGHTNVMTYS